MIYNIAPMPAPRMTRSDKWRKRPVVLAYFAFKDACRNNGVTIPEVPYIRFNIAMPASWSRKKRIEMNGEPHKQKPDIDNLTKALFDAVFTDDSHIWNVHAEKVWSVTPSIEVRDQND